MPGYHHRRSKVPVTPIGIRYRKRQIPTGCVAQPTASRRAWLSLMVSYSIHTDSSCVLLYLPRHIYIVDSEAEPLLTAVSEFHQRVLTLDNQGQFDSKMVNLPRPRVPRTFRSVHLTTKESRWSNADICPVPPEQHTYTNRAFLGYWTAAGINTTAWALGSSNLAAGLDIGGALGGIFLGSVLAGITAFLCGEPGVRYRVGFSMMSRVTFGMYGAWFVVVLKCFVNCIL